MEKLHTATASICADVHRLDLELKTPPSRRWARLLMIAAVGVLLLIAIVLMARRVPELQTTQITFSSRASEVCKLENFLAEGVLNKKTTIACLCRNHLTSWCQITTLHIYIATTSNASQPFNNALTVTKDEGSTNLSIICADPADAVKQQICESAMSRVINSKDSRTNLETGSAYTSPEQLYAKIADWIETTSYEEANNHAYLVNSNGSRLYNYSDAITTLLRDMAYQLARSNRSTAKDFWDASQHTRNMYQQDFAFGMEVNWTAYLQNCAPVFCDVQFKVSVLNRGLRAMGQVGGITTMVSLGIRFALWPLLRTALNFSTAPP